MRSSARPAARVFFHLKRTSQRGALAISHQDDFPDHRECRLSLLLVTGGESSLDQARQARAATLPTEDQASIQARPRHAGNLLAVASTRQITGIRSPQALNEIRIR